MIHRFLGAAMAGAALLTSGIDTGQTVQPASGPARIRASLISLKDALALAQGALSACAKRGETTAAIVTDADGNQRAALSSDDMVTVGLTTARLKTATVLEFHVSTRDFAARMAADPAFRAQYENDNRYFTHPGALPLYRDRKFVGVLALGGGHDKDEACALDALAVLPWASTKP